MTNKKSENPDQELPQDIKPKCGIIMPISAINGLSENHWADVRNLLFNIIEDAGFEPNVVSDGSDVGVIHNRIINNIYTSDIIVCDVSEKNPNVMLELGLRLAFDKPVIIIKDDKTSYSFDASLIEHLGYPRDLRYTLIEEFKLKLKAKIINTHEKAKDDPNYTTFLGHFKIYNLGKLETKEVSDLGLIMKSLDELRTDINLMRRNNQNISFKNNELKLTNESEELLTKLNIKRKVMEYIDKYKLSIEHLNDKEEASRLFNYLADQYKVTNRKVNLRWIIDSIEELKLNTNF